VDVGIGVPADRVFYRKIVNDQKYKMYTILKESEAALTKLKGEQFTPPYTKARGRLNEKEKKTLH